MLGDETLYLFIVGDKKLSQNAQSEKGSFYDAVECRKYKKKYRTQISERCTLSQLTSQFFGNRILALQEF